MAAVTLSQGIEVAILDSVPEITEVVDVTDHASGDEPVLRGRQEVAPTAAHAPSLRSGGGVFGGVVGDGGVGAGVRLDRLEDLGELSTPGSRTSSRWAACRCARG